MWSTLKLVNRHALLFLPLVGLTFVAIAGGLLTSFGLDNLFKDDIDRGWLNLIFSARVQTQVYATAVMGLVWSVFVLIEEFDRDRSDRLPIKTAGELVWPGIFILSLIQLGAAIINITGVPAGPPQSSHEMLLTIARSAFGMLVGLAFVWLVIKVSLAVARWTGVHHLFVVLLLSAIALFIAGLSLLLVPLMSIFIGLGFLVIVYSLFELAKTQGRFALMVLILLSLVVGASVEFKYQVPGLEDHYRRPRAERVPLTGSVPSAIANLVSPLSALGAWRDRQRRSGQPTPKFVVVMASGGGYRATFWTAIVLDRLRELENARRLPGFTGGIRLLTGASGGMVAAAYFTALQSETGAGNKGVRSAIEEDIASTLPFFSNAHRDSLTAVVQALSRNDAPKTFLPLVNLYDRGRALEKQWKTLAHSFRDLATGERAGWRPSLILSPMLIDAGRPLFISNLDLSEIIGREGRAVEFFRLFPDVHGQFLLATAARMSATFPYITPTVSLPTREPQRVVDAGYFDNSGLGTAAAFLQEPKIADWIRQNTSGIILIEIDAFDGTIEEGAAREPHGDPWCRETSPQRKPQQASAISELLDRAPRSLQWLTSPLEGVVAARSAGSQYYNQQLIRTLYTIYSNGRGGSLLERISLRNSARASLSWHLPEWELKCLMEEIYSPANAAEISKLEGIWNGR
jgi:hypothetical protein